MNNSEFITSVDITQTMIDNFLTAANQTLQADPECQLLEVTTRHGNTLYDLRDEDGVTIDCIPKTPVDAGVSY